MKTIIRIAVSLVLCVIFSAPVLAGWKEKITRNQLQAREYILKLKDGADPDKVKRPSLRRVDKYKGKQANSEIREAMNNAEKLARAGKHRKIEEPEFTFKGIDIEKYQELQSEKKK